MFRLNNTFSSPRYVRIFFVILLFGIAGLLFVLSFFQNTQTAGTSALPAATTTVATTTHEEKRYFSDVALDARAAYIYDIRAQKPLYAYNADTPVPLASLTKIITILTARDYFSDEDRIELSPTALAQEGNYGFFLYDQVRFKDSERITLLASSNDMAEAIREAYDTRFASASTTPATFLDAMNAKAQTIGLTTVSFKTASGLDLENETVPGSMGTAKDVAELLTYVAVHEPDLLAITQSALTGGISGSYGLSYSFENTNLLVDEIPWLVGGKTGFTGLAGGNLAVVFNVGLAHPVVAVVLGSTREGRFTDMQKLIDATFIKLEDEQK